MTAPRNRLDELWLAARGRPEPADETPLQLAARGWHVFPVDSPELERCARARTSGHDPATCTDRGKHQCGRWSRDASVDPGVVAA